MRKSFFCEILIRTCFFAYLNAFCNKFSKIRKSTLLSNRTSSMVIILLEIRISLFVSSCCTLLRISSSNRFTFSGRFSISIFSIFSTSRTQSTYCSNLFTAPCIEDTVSNSISSVSLSCGIIFSR